MSRNAIVVALFFLLGLVPLAAQEHPVRRQFLLNRDIVALAKAGYSEQTIIDTMLAKPNRFDTAAEALDALAEQGISQRVIEAMLVAKACGPTSDLTAEPRPACGTAPEAHPVQAAHSRLGELPVAAKDVPYRVLIEIRVNGHCPFGSASLSLAGGALPKGVELNLLGLDGTPVEMGRFQFTIRASNVCASILRTYELVVTGKPILEAAPDEITFSSPTPAQPPAPKTILVSSTWPSLPYTVETRDAAWLRAVQERGVTPDLDSAMTGDVVTLTVDTTGLKPGTYRGSVLFWTRHGANAPRVPVVLVVPSQP